MPRRPARPRAAPRVTRYAPAARLHQLRAMLDGPEGLTIYDVAERFGVNPRTALRYLQALLRAGEPLFEDTSRDTSGDTSPGVSGATSGRRKVWRLMPTARRQAITFTTAQMVALFLSRRVFDFLAGTGFKEDLDDVFAKVEATLRRRDATAMRNLDRKVFDVNEARHLYDGRIEDVGDILTALLRDERLRVTHEGVSGGKKTFVLEPYTLLVYKKGLYLAGRSLGHEGQVRTFALDGFREVAWLRGERFEYPEGWRPERITEGAFGLYRGTGPVVRVRVRFDEKVARYVRRRMWHPTQAFSRVPGGAVEMTMELSGTVEVVSWVLGFGGTAEVMAPESLRREVAAEAARAAARYRT